MKENKLSSINSDFYYCYSKVVSIILDVPEVHIISDKRLLSIEINYDSMALSSKLFIITRNYVEKYCETHYVKGEEILKRLIYMSDGLYCLITKTGNLKYCKTFVSHPEMLHYVILEKKGSEYFIIDFLENVRYYQKVFLKSIDFTDSILCILKKKNEKKIVSSSNIIKYYEEENKKHFEIYIKELSSNHITLQSAIDFATSGLLSSRRAIVDLFLLEEGKSLNYWPQLEEVLSNLYKLSEKIKLLLVKLHFSNTLKDLEKLKKNIYLFEKYEALLIKIIRR